MFERFTDRGRRVIVLAQDEARELDHNYIGTEHLLLGVIREEEGVGARALQSLGVSLTDVRGAVIEIIGRGTKPPSGHIPFTPRAKKVMELALRESLQLAHNYIGTEHLLLGLVREGEGVAAQVLARFGVELDRTREAVLKLLDVEPEASRDPGARRLRGFASTRSRRQESFDERDELRVEVARLRRLLEAHGIDPDETS